MSTSLALLALAKATYVRGAQLSEARSQHCLWARLSGSLLENKYVRSRLISQYGGQAE